MLRTHPDVEFRTLDVTVTGSAENYEVLYAHA